MIEMEIETVLTGDGGQNPVGHLQAQRLADCSNRSLTAVAVSSGGATMTALAGTVTVPEHSAVNVTSVGGQRRDECSGSGARMAGRPMRPKNGQHQPQQQKLNKRRYSMNASFKQSGYGKRRRRANSESDPVLPTNFLLGGNIFDPLNLNSLLDEEVNRTLNAETPKSSPLPAKSHDPVEILIPKDITDPLNLNSAGGDDDILVSPMKSRKRHRNRHHGGVGGMPAAQMDSGEIERGKAAEDCVAALSSTAVHAVPEPPREGAVLVSVTSVLESPQPYELNTSINCRDEVVAPILPCRHSHKTTSIPQKSQSKAPGSSGCLTSVVSCQPPSSRHRKRRRTSSRTDASSIPPTPSSQRGSVEPARGRATRGRSQTFHTPLVGGAHGHGAVTNHHGHQRSLNRRKERKFQYGNYSKYYGYRNPGLCEDPRMRVLRPEWFRGKVVLDLGCNTGHLTLSIAKNMQPARILGLDIDGGLVRAARQNVRHFLSELQTQEARRGPKTDHWEHGVSTEPRGSRTQDMEAEGVPSGEAGREPFSASYFPLSLRICRGPIAAPPIFVTGNEEFPANVTFVKENYVLQSDALLQAQQPEYDVILCLSLTKWVHLNWGDAGLQRLFKRAFRQLRPGGLFILEPQPWSSYGRRKKLTDTIYKNYYNIRLKPDQFSSYLTSEVGFSSYELIGTPKTMSKGFLRAIYLFHKGPSSYRK
uniref:RNA methyltransferase n=1 Tax=Paramormyrops kingsleyae TaxID=1676925 RepID=A0A3B3QF72_9TELE|nr:7SK snRNA methylphosphate capping enzyme [Paramormyrops kingsleyae]XP_023653428.1 7SK snRNA methylphosphate capping enzyme [Paramormyrops kingsleyae]